MYLFGCHGYNMMYMYYRVAVVGVVTVGILMIPVVQVAQGDQLFTYIQAITNCLSPPIAAAYLLAILWPRTNEIVCYNGVNDQ